MRYWVILSFLVIGTVMWGQQPEVYSAEELKEDLEYTRNTIEEYNPALGIFHPYHKFQETFDSLIREIDRPMNDLEFYPILRRLMAETREGHAYIGTATDTTPYYIKGFLKNEFKFLPLNVKYIHGKAYIWRNFSSKDSPGPGDELISINGRSLLEIIRAMEPYMVADGNITSSRLHQVFSRFATQYYYFVERPEVFKVVYKNATTGQVREIKIPAITRGEMIYWRNKRYGVPETDSASIEDVYTFEVSDRIALLTLKTFNKGKMKKYKINPKKLFKDLFTEIESSGVTDLIIDLRDNPGGRVEYFTAIMPYLLNEKQKQQMYETRSWKGREKVYRFKKPKKYAFDGDLFVLVNAGSFSNGSVVAWYAKEYAGAFVLGEESGSRVEGFAAGSRVRTRLPNTGIAINIPKYLFLYSRDGDRRNKGVVPDVTIVPSIEDLLAGKDVVLDKAMKLAIDN